MDCSDKSDASPDVASILHHRRAFPSRPQIQSLRYNQLSYSFWYKQLISSHSNFAFSIDL